MALEWIDNFSLYGIGGQARLTNGAYAEASNIGGGNLNLVDDPDPNITATVVRIRGSGLAGGTTLRKVLAGTTATVGIAHRAWLSRLPNSVNERVSVASFRDVSNNVLCSVAVDTTGALSAWRGLPNSGTLLGSTAGPVLVANAWQHIEVRSVLDSTTGEVQVWVEGVQVLNLTNVNTSAADLGCAQVAFNSTITTTTPDYFIKDVVIWNALGSYNNAQVGPLIVTTIVPDGDVALNWTPVGAANGWSILDNSPPVDANYIEAGDSPIPGAYQATLTDLPADVTSVAGVMAVSRSRKVDGGDGNIQVSAVSGVSVATGADRPITAAFTYWADIFEEDPATSALWTPAGVDAMQLRLNRTV